MHQEGSIYPIIIRLKLKRRHEIRKISGAECRSSNCNTKCNSLPNVIGCSNDWKSLSILQLNSSDQYHQPIQYLILYQDPSVSTNLFYFLLFSVLSMSSISNWLIVTCDTTNWYWFGKFQQNRHIKFSRCFHFCTVSIVSGQLKHLKD